MLFMHVIYPCIVFQPRSTVYTLISAAETTVPRYFFSQVGFCYILRIVGFFRQVDGKRREETTFLLSSCSPTLSHQLCLLVLMPAVDHRLQLILGLLEAQRMSPQGAAVGANALCFCGLRSPCMTSLKFWDPILSILFSELQSGKWFPPSKLFPLATTAFTFSCFALLPRSDRFLYVRMHWLSWNI